MARKYIIYARTIKYFVPVWFESQEVLDIMQLIVDHKTKKFSSVEFLPVLRHTLEQNLEP